MPPAHWRLILNGKSAGDDALRDAVQALRERGQRLDVRVTWERGDADRIVAEALEDGVGVLIAAGGDGTLSEVATALASRDRPAGALPALGLVPMGTANDFAAAGSFPETPLPALELVAARPATPIDLLRLEAGGDIHWAANLASGGFGTQVTVETHDGLKKILGGLAYMVTGMAKVGRIEPIAARMRGPDFAWEGNFIALGVGANLAQVSFPPELPYATSLLLETGKRVTPDELLEKYLKRFGPWYEIWLNDGLAPVLEAIRPLSATLGRRVLVGTREGEAVGFREDGALMFREGDHVVPLVAGDVSVRGLYGYV